MADFSRFVLLCEGWVDFPGDQNPSPTRHVLVRGVKWRYDDPRVDATDRSVGG